MNLFNVREIIRNNNATFYNFDSQKKQSQKSRAIATCFVAIIGALIFPKISDDLLAGFLAVQSILLGFTFNVMFFLLGNREKNTTPKSSIEGKLRAKRLRDLYHELFYNVSYFNLVAISSIVVALLLLLPTPEIPGFLSNSFFVKKFVHWMDTSTLPITATFIFRSASVFVFYTIVIEVIFSIARVVGRTSFYFERKIDEAKLLGKEDQS
jgi:hypothetical protein